MMLTTSDIHTLVTQGIRTRYGRLIDPDQAFRDWLEAHDQAVINAALAFAFADVPQRIVLAPGQSVGRSLDTYSPGGIVQPMELVGEVAPDGR